MKVRLKLSKDTLNTDSNPIKTVLSTDVEKDGQVMTRRVVFFEGTSEDYQSQLNMTIARDGMKLVKEKSYVFKMFVIGRIQVVPTDKVA